MQAQTVQAIFSVFHQANPTPRGELIYQSPFELLVAVILSAQATDISVNAATQKLYAMANTPQTIAALGVEGLIPYIRSIGLYRTKAKHIIATCEMLLSQHDGKVPTDRAALQMLPGVGRKTANVVLNIAFGFPTIAVDTHVFRVANRTGLARGHTVEAVEAKLEKAVPKQFKVHAHHWLILHGRYVCKARQPLCKNCLIVDLCQYKAKVL